MWGNPRAAMGMGPYRGGGLNAELRRETPPLRDFQRAPGPFRDREDAVFNFPGGGGAQRNLPGRTNPLSDFKGGRGRAPVDFQGWEGPSFDLRGREQSPLDYPGSERESAGFRSSEGPRFRFGRRDGPDGFDGRVSPSFDSDLRERDLPPLDIRGREHPSLDFREQQFRGRDLPAHDIGAREPPLLDIRARPPPPVNAWGQDDFRGGDPSSHDLWDQADFRGQGRNLPSVDFKDRNDFRRRDAPPLDVRARPVPPLDFRDQDDVRSQDPQTYDFMGREPCPADFRTRGLEFRGRDVRDRGEGLLDIGALDGAPLDTGGLDGTPVDILDGASLDVRSWGKGLPYLRETEENLMTLRPKDGPSVTFSEQERLGHYRNRGELPVDFHGHEGPSSGFSDRERVSLGYLRGESEHLPFRRREEHTPGSGLRDRSPVDLKGEGGHAPDFSGRRRLLSPEYGGREGISISSRDRGEPPLDSRMARETLEFLGRKDADYRDRDYRDFDHRRQQSQTFDYQHTKRSIELDLPNDYEKDPKDRDYRMDSKEGEVSTSILLKGIPRDATKEDILAALRNADGSQPAGLQVTNYKPGYSHGFANVEFSLLEDAVRCMDTNQKSFTICGKSVTAQYESPPCDWYCKYCRIKNFPNRLKCFKCSTPKAEAEALDPPTSQQQQDLQQIEPLNPEPQPKQEKPQKLLPQPPQQQQPPPPDPTPPLLETPRKSPAWQSSADPSGTPQPKPDPQTQEENLPPQTRSEPSQEDWQWSQQQESWANGAQSKTMIIKNLAPFSTVQSILKALDPFAYLAEKNVRVIKKKRFRDRQANWAYAFVEMCSPSEASRLVKILQGLNPPLYIDGNPTIIEMCKTERRDPMNSESTAGTQTDGRIPDNKSSDKKVSNVQPVGEGQAVPELQKQNFWDTCMKNVDFNRVQQAVQMALNAQKRSQGSSSSAPIPAAASHSLSIKEHKDLDAATTVFPHTSGGKQLGNTEGSKQQEHSNQMKTKSSAQPESSAIKTKLTSQGTTASNSKEAASRCKNACPGSPADGSQQIEVLQNRKIKQEKKLKSSASTANQSPAQTPASSPHYKYTVPDTSTYQYDATSGFYYDPQTQLYYEPNSRYYYNTQTQQYLYWDGLRNNYLPVPNYNAELYPQVRAPPVAGSCHPPADFRPQHDEGRERRKEKRERSDSKEKSEKSRSKPPHKVAKDMERWANKQKETVKRASPPTRPPFKEEDSKQESKAGNAAFVVFGTKSMTLESVVAEEDPFKKPMAPEDPFKKPLAPVKKKEESTVKPQKENVVQGLVAYGDDSDEEEEEEEEKVEQKPTKDTEEEKLIDWRKLVCLLCRRQFPNKEGLVRHQQLSELHKQNLEIHRKIRMSQMELEYLEKREREENTAIQRRIIRAKRELEDLEKSDREKRQVKYRDRGAERRDAMETRRRRHASPTSRAGERPAKRGVGSDYRGNRVGGKDNTGVGHSQHEQSQSRSKGASPGAHGSSQNTKLPGSYRDAVRKAMFALYKEK
ncbi:RNA-binding protein 5 [Latimeria chalumnae]|uniref:RNA-binding protein 5 n=1 Tax=Latimeria chalumnae TaxID=7897 RepID=UPI0006D90DF5|nr:PREDICTED: RNA-binding protein 5 [Latimeria chalumnae]|eukprot:XP_014351055.1 PREDICTED: RNA-binding protein 5 [Latimeria chalumnae]